VKRGLFRTLALTGAAAGAIEVIAWLRMHAEEREHAGETLHVEEYGSGKPVLLIPGLQASTRYWGDVRPLADDRRLLLVDLLGFGRSPWPMHASYDLGEHVEWLHRTLLARDAARGLTIVAHSFGTIVAAHYAARYGVDRLFLLGTPVFTDEEEARARIRAMSSIAALFSLNRVLAREGCMFLCAFRPVLKGLAHFARPDLPAEVTEDAVMHHWPSIRGAIDILLRVPIESALERIGPMTTFVHGTNDTVTPMERIHAVASLFGARVHEVPDGNHHGYRPVLHELLG
jgi:pimeloyl-ACP methyl ester carboxylesterase